MAMPTSGMPALLTNTVQLFAYFIKKYYLCRGFSM